MKIRWGKVILSSLAFFVIAMVVRQIEAMLTMKYYLMPEFFSVWSKVMMPSAGPPPFSFHLISALFSLVTGITLAIFYDFIKDNFKGGAWGRIYGFTVWVFWLSVIFFAFTAYLLVNLPAGLQVWWMASSLIVYFLSAIAFNKILK